MQLIKQLIQIKEGNDLSRLPADVVKSLRTNIRKGAEDLQQKWANALELVHKSYEVEGVQRPTPDMKEAWKQYEELLAYAVNQLAENRGMDDDWRMSSSIFHEAMKPTQNFRVKIGADEYLTEAPNLDSLVSRLTSDTGYDAKIVESDSGCTIYFSRHKVRQETVKITQL